MPHYVAEGTFGFCGTEFVIDVGEGDSEQNVSRQAHEAVCEHAESMGIVFVEDYVTDDDWDAAEEAAEDDGLNGMVLDSRDNLDYIVRERTTNDENELDI